MPTLGWSEFALKRHRSPYDERGGTGNSWSTREPEAIVQDALENWDQRTPGAGETGLDRKVLVPITKGIDLGWYVCPQLRLDDINNQGLTNAGVLEEASKAKAMPVRGSICQRQEGEDYFTGNHIPFRMVDLLNLIPEFAKFVNVVCYSKDALLENDGERSTSADWEIVCLLCTPIENEPMSPLAMARNQLEKVGGTKGEYTAEEYAKAVYYWSQRIRIR
ncbi:MAG: DUF3228 family protein [Candidatus Thorarchaeota archaeon]|jgi:hypothetical protein